MTQEIPSESPEAKQAREEKEAKEKAERQHVALLACQRYLEYGTSLPIGQIPASEILPLAESVKDVELPHVYAELHAAQLELEASMSLAREYPNGGWESELEPHELFEAAIKRYQAIYKNSQYEPHIRARAQLAEASTELYKLIATDATEFDMLRYTQQLVTAAKHMLRYHDASKDHSLTHDLHCLNLSLLMTRFFHEAPILTVTAPGRFQQELDDNRCDLLLVRFYQDGTFDTDNIRIAAQEGGVRGQTVVLSPTFLLNEAWPSTPRLRGHGSLRAQLDMLHGRQSRKHVAWQRQLEDTHTTILSEFLTQSEVSRQNNTGGIAEVDIETARLSYDVLSPLYVFKAEDKPKLEACILSHEEDLKETKNAEDFHRLGWLWTEYANLPGESHNYKHGKVAFEKAAELAAAEQNWLLFFESKLGAVTTQAYKAMHPELQSDTDVATELKAYRRQLMKLVVHASRLLAQQEEMVTSSELSELQKVVRAFSAMLIINSDTEDEHIAVFPSSRQRAIHSGRIGSDVLVIPYDTVYKPECAGKLRFDVSEKHTLDSGIATIASTKLAKVGWNSDEVILEQSLRNLYRLLENRDTFQLDEQLTAIRNSLLDDAILTMTL